MKRAYTKPILQIENFEPQEYVANCFRLTKVQVSCARPGNSGYQIGDGTAWGTNHELSIEGADDRYEYNDGNQYHKDGYCYHGGCGNWNPIYLDGSLTGKEYIGDVISNIDNVKIGAVSNNNYYTSNLTGSTKWNDLNQNATYEATWQSYDGKGTTYHHYGALKVTGEKSFS